MTTPPTALSPDPVTRSRAYFAGGWHALERTFPVVHPGNGQVIGEVAA